MAINGRPLSLVNRYNAEMKARVNPVGPTKVIGCPENILYIIPEDPQETINWITPMLLLKSDMISK